MLALAVLTLAGVCVGQTYWKRAYGGGGIANQANAITATPDGNFIAAGYKTVSVDGKLAVYLIKLRPNGDTLWTKTYAREQGDYKASAIIPTQDGNFIVAGSHTTPSYPDSSKVFLLKINPNGDTICTKLYGGSGINLAFAIAPTKDNRFVVAGYSDSTYFGITQKIYLLKIDQNCDTIWTTMYGGAVPSSSVMTVEFRGWALAATGDGGFVVAAERRYSTVGNGGFLDQHMDVFLSKVDSSGDTIWTKAYAGDPYASVNAVTATQDGNFIVAGYISPHGGWDALYLLKIKPDGDTLWTKTYGFNESGYMAQSITPTQDGNFIVTGWRSGSPNMNDGLFILKIKPNGDSLWALAYTNCWANAVVPTRDKDFIVAGQSDSGSFFLSLIDDRYAKKDSLFTLKIPVGADSLDRTYSSVKIPSGMTISSGGTISWTPKTDSVYVDLVEMSVADKNGRKDTLTFNIIVNSKVYPARTINPVSRSTNPDLNDITIRSFSSKEVRFSLPGSTSSLRIYDVRGQLLENLSVKGGQASWQSKRAAGRYFAKAILEKKEMVKGFTVVR
jgi:hypothetical protein